MNLFLYNIFLLLFKASMAAASLFNPKAKKWLSGRKNIFEQLEKTITHDSKIVWMHCASLGEFEQGLPVLEAIKSTYKNHKILLTFFSPSGYEIQKDNKIVDWVFYLPMDGAENAKRFLAIVQPSLVLFVKYEYWYHYLKNIKEQKIPALLVSALFLKNENSFNPYKTFQRSMLYFFDQLFVQTAMSKKYLEEIGLGSKCTFSNDTRFDRVFQIAKQFKPNPFIEKFIGTHKTIIAGSTWPEDEEILQHSLSVMNSLKLIIAPHEINEKNLSILLQKFPGSQLYSQLTEANQRPTNAANNENSNCIIIDNYGMLSSLYKYAFISYVGGGHTKNGVHNVLEAAVYGKPVLFGPYYKKYNEAIGLVEAGGGFSFKNETSFNQLLEQFTKNENDYTKSCAAAAAYVNSNKGATEKVMGYIQENRLLTN